MRTKRASGVHALLIFLSLVAAATGPAAQSGAPASQNARPPSDATLVARVQSALAAARDLPGRAIAVAAAKGLVTLTGTVGSTIELQSLGAVVRAVPGVRDVRFHVKVQAPPAPPRTPAAAPPA